jgi:hypothetical protein
MRIKVDDPYKNLLSKLQKIDPKGLQDAYNEIEAISNEDPENPIVSSEFEIDNKMYSVPFQSLRTYLQNNRSPANPLAIPKSTPDTKDLEVYSYDPSPSEPGVHTNTDPYYWDIADPYEHMNPSARKSRVLDKK